MMKSKLGVLFVALLVIFAFCAQASAAEFDLSGLTRVVNGKTIGPTSFVMQKEAQFKNSYGVSYEWIEMGVGGAIDGYTALQGHRYETFTDYPDIVLRGRGNFEPYYHGVGTYDPSDKTRLVILFPSSASDWNGKLYHIAHTAPAFTALGVVDEPAGDAEKLYAGLGVYFTRLMLDKGYAVLYSYRSSSNETGVGPSTVTLDDGTVLDNKAFGMHTGLFQDLTMVGKKYVEHRLGGTVKRMYFYGKSQGGNLGRLFNYAPGANVNYKDPAKKVFDGFIHNSPGGGLFLPILYKDSSGAMEPLFSTDEDRKNFAPQIDVLKNIYVGEQYIDTAYWGTYYEVNRDNQRLLNAQGLGALSRTYELQGVSHEDRRSVYLPFADSDSMNPEQGGFMDAMIDLLDRWVEQGVVPPATRSNSYDLGDVDGDGVLDNPAIELPEIAAPIGEYYLFPQGQDGSGNLGFVAYTATDLPIWNRSAASTSKGEQTRPANFDEAWLEPLDNFGVFVDMNGNGVRDTKESVTKAWRRRANEGHKYGVLGPNEVITNDRYEAEITRVAAELYAEGFMSARGMRAYIEAARALNVE